MLWWRLARVPIWELSDYAQSGQWFGGSNRSLGGAFAPCQTQKRLQSTLSEWRAVVVIVMREEYTKRSAFWGALFGFFGILFCFFLVLVWCFLVV